MLIRCHNSVSLHTFYMQATPSWGGFFSHFPHDLCRVRVANNTNKRRNNSMNAHLTIRDRGNRLILGFKDDVRITADYLPSLTSHISDDGLPSMTPKEWEKLVNAILRVGK